MTDRYRVSYIEKRPSGSPSDDRRREHPMAEVDDALHLINRLRPEMDSGEVVDVHLYRGTTDVEWHELALSGAPLCIFCGTDVDPRSPETYQRVVGWERKRSAGGTNQITLREPSWELACSVCIRRRKQGVAQGQAALL